MLGNYGRETEGWLLQLNLRLYSEDDKQFMKKLWLESFRDSEEHIERFFETVLPDSYGVIGEYYHKCAAAICLIPAMIGNDKAFYLYAAAVDPAFRERGIMTEIMKRLFEWGENHQYWIFLKSGNLDSARFGVHNGMEKALYYNCISCRKSKATPAGVNMIVRDITDDEYLDCRKSFNGGRQFARWIDSFIKFGLYDFREAGGRVVRIRYGYANFAALLTSVKNCLVLSEALANDADIKSVLPHLLHRFNIPVAISFSPCNELKRLRYSAYIKGYDDKKYSYFYH